MSNPGSVARLILMMLGVLFVGGIVGMFLFGAMRNRDIVAPAAPELDQLAIIPPIDISAPANTETATFALG